MIDDLFKLLMKQRHYYILIIFFIQLTFYQYQTSVQADCNSTALETWKAETYEGILSADPTFWIYQAQKQLVLTNQLALELATSACENKFYLLSLYEAGRMGPINLQYSYDVMCSKFCLESDKIHQDVMKASGCSCLELSTQPNSNAYHIYGDWCRQNTARMLCDDIGYCGIWNCRMDDFMCPRYEWDKMLIPLRGLGSCNSGVKNIYSIAFIAFLTCGMILLLMI
eukprot:gene10776-14469_t